MNGFATRRRCCVAPAAGRSTAMLLAIVIVIGGTSAVWWAKSKRSQRDLAMKTEQSAGKTRAAPSRGAMSDAAANKPSPRRQLKIRGRANQEVDLELTSMEDGHLVARFTLAPRQLLRVEVPPGRYVGTVMAEGRVDGVLPLAIADDDDGVMIDLAESRTVKIPFSDVITLGK